MFRSPPRSGRRNRLLTYVGGRSAALAVLVACAACAPATRAPQPPSPSEIPALKARMASDTTPRTRTLLAAAYRAAGQPDSALALLQPLVASGSGGPTAQFFLGLTYEDLHRYEAARRVYEAYLHSAGSDSLKAQVRDRLALLNREELQAAARSALSREAELRGTPPAPHTIAVFPFVEQGNPRLRPLGRALAELLTTDLGETDRLKVLERARVQYLIDEMKLGSSGLVDPSTAARTGHLLGAGRIVQGRIGSGGQGVALQALLVPVGAADTTVSGRPLAERGPLARLFDMEKSLALGIYSAMGIQLTTAERERITRKPTSNIQALLAFGAGLEAQDAGHYQEATRDYARALRLDPSFNMVRAHLQTAQQLHVASVQTPRSLTVLAMTTAQKLAPAVTRARSAGFFTSQVMGRMAGALPARIGEFNDLLMTVPDPELRNAFPEAFGLEGLVHRATLNIILRIP